MQAQAQQVAQAVTQSEGHFDLMVLASATLLAAVIGSALTLYWQQRREKRGAKLNLFLNLMAHRKANPPNQAWVNALNMIDVIFYDTPRVIAAWRSLYPILQDETKNNSEERVHAYIQLLSEMAAALSYPKLQQIDIDKFYSPQIYAQQAHQNAQAQEEILSMFRGLMLLVAQKVATETGKMIPEQIGIGISSPDEGMAVARGHDVTGWVHPDAHVQVLVFSDLWYPQNPVHRMGNKWRVLASFGNDKSRPGQPYKIIAIVSETQVTGPVKELPNDAIRSPEVLVTRGTFQMQPPG